MVLMRRPHRRLISAHHFPTSRLSLFILLGANWGTERNYTGIPTRECGLSEFGRCDEETRFPVPGRCMGSDAHGGNGDSIPPGAFGFPALDTDREKISVMRSDSSDLDATARQDVKRRPGSPEWRGSRSVPDARSARQGRSDNAFSSPNLTS
ncbi:hypothetical protein VUR80DRAFT_2944 [Thermomyces stellatus]